MSPVAAPAIGGRPRAATGGFPYLHRTVAEVEAEASRKRPTLRAQTVARRQAYRIARRRKG